MLFAMTLVNKWKSFFFLIRCLMHTCIGSYKHIITRSHFVLLDLNLYLTQQVLQLLLLCILMHKGGLFNRMTFERISDHHEVFY